MFVLNMLSSSCAKWSVLLKNFMLNFQSVPLRRVNTVVCQKCKSPAITDFPVKYNSIRKFSDKHSLDNETEELTKDSVLKDFLKEIKQDFGEGTRAKEISNSLNNEETETVEKGNSGISKSIEEKFQQYRDDDAEIILSSEEKSLPVTSWKQSVVEAEEEEEFFLYREKTDKLDRYTEFFERGKTGAFDIAQVVHILREEKVYNVAVIKIPPAAKYCDYMVLGTARSKRHLQAVVEFIRRLHKKKKLKNEPYLKIEGGDNSEWKVMDMKNIVFHLFLPEIRQYYDIECLWTVGEEYDTLCNKKQDLYEDLLEQHIEFLKHSEPLN
ncbi:uncharacterized protein [Centruroides vittatus]|uniref:uncharacterized protein n=1 Tax=Centruroides vittatus TaxID=120091 RepID=UPI00350F2F5E